MHFDEEKIERLITISKQKPLLPEEFIPWELEPKEDEKFLSDCLVSLHGHPLFDTLSPDQKRELGRHEMVQSMYSYAWTEGLACLFFNKRLLTLTDNTSPEYRFLVRQLIEEFRHQDMFASAVKAIAGKAIIPNWIHVWLAKISIRYLPHDVMFMSVLAVEEVADVYGKIVRKDEEVYPVLRKVSELHHIEEGRHIFYTKMWLDKFTQKAGFIKRTIYSLIFLTNIVFLRSLYVRKEIFERIGVDDPEYYYQIARRHFKSKFAAECLQGAIEYVKDFRGFNALTRPLWRRILGVKLA